jgi:hypothetical protein
MSQRYWLTSLASLFFASACAAFFCFVVDPYKLFPSVPGLSQETSVDLLYKLRLHKPYAIEDVKPNALILGSSRAAGLPPGALQSLDGVAYNASLPGATLNDMRQMVEHAQVIEPLKIIVISVDYNMFREGYSEKKRLGEPHRYQHVDSSLRQRMQHHTQRAADYYKSLFSLDTMIDSFLLLFGKARSPLEYLEDGTWIIDQKKMLVPAYQRYSNLSRLIYDEEISHKSQRIVFDEFLDLLDFAEANDIRVIVLISPLQGMLMHTLKLAGTWDLYIRWQHDLVDTITARDTNCEIYGLDDNPLLVLEKIKAPQGLFDDGVHYNRKAGTQILTCLTGPCKSSLQPTRLHSHSISTYLEKVDTLRLQYAQENPEDITKTLKWLSRRKGS